MAQEYHNPFIIRFSRNTPESTKPNELVLSDGFQRDLMKTISSQLNSGEYDYIAVSFDDTVQNKRQCNMMMTLINKVGSERLMPVINRQNQKLYLTNPREFKDFGRRFVVDDTTVKERFEKYTPEQWEWRRHKILETMHDMYPLSNKSDEFNRNEFAKLTDPKRGLEAPDLTEFFSYPAGRVIVPGLFKDDFVGMFGVNASTYDMNFFVGDKPIDEPVLSYKHKGYSGYVIPMKTQHNLYGRPQVGTNTNAFNTKLRVKHVSGHSVNKNDYSIEDITSANKSTYTFYHTDGRCMYLRVTDVINETMAQFEDEDGRFEFPVGGDLIDSLKGRGYDIHPDIKSIQLVNSAKYSWIGAGDLCGSEKLAQELHPADAGFVFARPPQPGHGSTVIVVEGALKGRIVGKYITTHDKNGRPIANEIVPEGNGIIIAQVAGTNGKAAKSVRRIAETQEISNVILAFDADGRTNRNVAIGINNAESILQNLNCGTLSWNPDLKGMDDMLLAVKDGKATVEDCDLRIGTAEELFPVEQAEYPGSISLSGQLYYDSWQDEYHEELQQNRMDHEKALNDGDRITFDHNISSDMFAPTPVSNVQRVSPQQTQLPLLLNPELMGDPIVLDEDFVLDVTPDEFDEPIVLDNDIWFDDEPIVLASDILFEDDIIVVDDNFSLDGPFYSSDLDVFASEPSESELVELDPLVSRIYQLTPEQYQEVLEFVNSRLDVDSLEP